MSEVNKPPIRIDTSGGAYIEGTVYVGGDFVGRDRVTVFDTTVTRWLALSASNLLSWLRLLGTAILLGLLVALVAYQLVGSAGSNRSLALAIIHGALGAALGGLIAWYSPTLPAALLRVAWIEGGLIAAELVLLILFPASPSGVPSWFGLPVLHASMLVAFVAGPWLALVTFVLVRVVHIDRRSLANRQWRSEALIVVGSCLAAGLLVLVFGQGLNEISPPIGTSTPIEDWISGQPIVYSDTRFDTHQDGFIVLPGWLNLSQAVAILASLAMIIPAAAALSVWPRGRRFRAARLTLVGGLVSAAMGVGLEIASSTAHPGQQDLLRSLRGPGGFPIWASASVRLAMGVLVWGTSGMVSGVTASLLRHSFDRVGLARAE